MGAVCVWEGVSVAAFYYWRKKLASGQPRWRTTGSPVATEVVSQASGPRSRKPFLPVRVAERFSVTAAVPGTTVQAPTSSAGHLVKRRAQTLSRRCQPGSKSDSRMVSAPLLPGIEPDTLHTLISTALRHDLDVWAYVQAPLGFGE